MLREGLINYNLDPVLIATERQPFWTSGLTYCICI